MRILFTLSVALLYTGMLGACQDGPSPTGLNEETRVDAMASSVPGGNEEGVIFDENAVTGIIVTGDQTGNRCLALVSDLDMNDFLKQQPNGHWSFHLQGHEATFKVTTPAGEVFSGTGQLTTELILSQNPLTVPDPTSILLS